MSLGKSSCSSSLRRDFLGLLDPDNECTTAFLWNIRNSFPPWQSISSQKTNLHLRYSIVWMMKSKRLWWLNQAECVKGCGDKGSVQNSTDETLTNSHLKPMKEMVRWYWDGSLGGGWDWQTWY
jgi:hypothetical protein